MPAKERSNPVPPPIAKSTAFESPVLPTSSKINPHRHEVESGRPVFFFFVVSCAVIGVIAIGWFGIISAFYPDHFQRMKLSLASQVSGSDVDALQSEAARLKSENDKLRKQVEGLNIRVRDLSSKETNAIEREKQLADSQRSRELIAKLSSQIDSLTGNLMAAEKSQASIKTGENSEAEIAATPTSQSEQEIAEEITEGPFVRLTSILREAVEIQQSSILAFDDAKTTADKNDISQSLVESLTGKFFKSEGVYISITGHVRDIIDSSKKDHYIAIVELDNDNSRSYSLLSLSETLPVEITKNQRASLSAGSKVSIDGKVSVTTEWLCDPSHGNIARQAFSKVTSSRPNNLFLTFLLQSPYTTPGAKRIGAKSFSWYMPKPTLVVRK